MAGYNSIWSSEEIFCQRCYKQKKGISLKNMKMLDIGLSLDLCARCISDIASETADFAV